MKILNNRNQTNNWNYKNATDYNGRNIQFLLITLKCLKSCVIFGITILLFELVGLFFREASVKQWKNSVFWTPSWVQVLVLLLKLARCVALAKLSHLRSLSLKWGDWTKECLQALLYYEMGMGSAICKPSTVSLQELRKFRKHIAHAAKSQLLGQQSLLKEDVYVRFDFKFLPMSLYSLSFQRPQRGGWSYDKMSYWNMHSRWELVFSIINKDNS